MGEKGIGGAAAEVAAHGGSSLIEKTTTSVVTSVSGVGSDIVSTVQEKAVGAFADEAIRAAREQVAGDEATRELEAEPPPEDRQGS